ncbi:hypothetical protein L0Y40_00835 [Candidatus Wolfebacteria bacterium]|nr:hypothetical protein [Candidatus Wolfebacteria bacterium]
MLKLTNVTLIGIDCVNSSRLSEAIDISEAEIIFGDVKLLSSIPTKDSRLVQIESIDTIEDFSSFCINELHKYVNTTYCLLIQWDGFVLNPDNWDESFLCYDYIGSPWVVKDWAIDDFNFPGALRGQRIVGNGGFSIRSKKFLEVSSRLSKEGKISRFHPEDIALCVWYRSELEKSGVTFAPVDLARRFSIEGADDVYDKQFGFHGFYSTNIDKWFDGHPQYRSLHKRYEDAKRSRHHADWKPSKI